MSRPAPEPSVTPMSAGERAVLALGAPWRSAVACSGCGQRPENLTPLHAVTAIRVLQRRCASLLGQPEHSLAHRRCEPGSWSAMEPAAQVSQVMGGADSRLRDLFGEEEAEPVPVAIEGAELAPAEQLRTPAAVLIALDGNVSGLVATITSATATDWDCPRPDDGATANEMVWLALHDATHHLEDAELLVDAALAAVQGRRRGP
jgi:hypothetical protein